jgi:hypothetical protein
MRPVITALVPNEKAMPMMQPVRASTIAYELDEEAIAQYRV